MKTFISQLFIIISQIEEYVFYNIFDDVFLYEIEKYIFDINNI